MNRNAKFLAGLAALALVGVSVAAAAATRAGIGEGSGAGATTGQCEVRVSRGLAAGTYDVTRQVLDSGGCICFVKTGPSGQGGETEGLVSSILRSRNCADAPPALASAGNPALLGTVGAAGRVSGGLLVVAGAGAAGGAVAAAAGGHDSP